MTRLLPAAALLLALSLTACSGEPTAEKPKPDNAQQAPTTQPADGDKAAATDDGEPVEIVNTHCPICGMKVDASLGTIEHEGKHYGVGCAACIDIFKKNPEEQIRKIEEAAAEAEKS